MTDEWVPPDVVRLVTGEHGTWAAFDDGREDPVTVGVVEISSDGTPDTDNVTRLEGITGWLAETSSGVIATWAGDDGVQTTTIT